MIIFLLLFECTLNCNCWLLVQHNLVCLIGWCYVVGWCGCVTDGLLSVLQCRGYTYIGCMGVVFSWVQNCGC